MRSFTFAWFATAFVFAASARAETKAEIVSSSVIWDQAPRNFAGDIVRFKDRWLVACVESTKQYAQDEAVRLLTSADGAKWESVDIIRSPAPKKGLYSPRFSVRPDGKLMLTAYGVVPSGKAAEPLPEYGGTARTMAWSSKDGRAWDRLDDLGPDYYPLSRLVWNKDVALAYGQGTICGIMQTVQIFSGKDGKNFKSQYEKTFSSFFPEAAALILDGDTAYCLMSRSDGGPGLNPAWFSSATAPYAKWEWKEMDGKFDYPNFLRLPDKRVIAALGEGGKKSRTVIGEFDLKAGKFTEFLELPTGGQRLHAGLAAHDGHLWVTYHAAHKGKSCVHLAKVKLK